MECKWCKGEIKKNVYGCCSYHCYEQWLKFTKEPNTECAICGRKLYIKPSALAKIKFGPTCSQSCRCALASRIMSGSGNHQYGLTGDLNASFKKSETITNYGYILTYVKDHPFPHDKSNQTTRVYQHRLVIEENADNFPSEFFIIIDGKKYLKQEYSVHHINGNKTDNRIENLQVCTKSEHTTLHNLQKEILRDEKTGRIVGIVKREEMGGNLERGNPQPVVKLTDDEGPTTNS